ncbi:hypothetical protein HYV10_02265 [Candidatus Dependentiae bacterium]|nr:hypothetical protein [Candidatus Dependentiae bacterium]
MSMYAKAKKNIVSYYQNLSEQYSAKYVKEFTIGMTLLFILVGGYFLNSWYTKRREEKAFDAFSELIISIEQDEQTVQSLNPIKDKEKIYQVYNDTLNLLDALYQEHIGSYLAPYFLALKSEIVFKQSQDYNQSLQLLDQALAGIDKKSSIGSLFYMKRIKMGLDSQDAKTKEDSFKALQQLANDTTSVLQQEAQYILGLYFLAHNDIVKAQNILKNLADSNDGSALIQSLWVKLAQEKLGLVSDK